MILGDATRRSWRCREQENGAVGHDSVDIENDQFDLFGSLCGHGVILSAEFDSLTHSRPTGRSYNFSYNVKILLFVGEQLAKVEKGSEWPACRRRKFQSRSHGPTR